MIQNAAARLVFNEPKSAHVTPLFISLHRLPVAARIKFKTLMLAYRTTTGSAPAYFLLLMTIYIPSRSLRSASERRLVGPSQRSSKSISRTLSFTTPGWWNDLPPLASAPVSTGCLLLHCGPRDVSCSKRQKPPLGPQENLTCQFAKWTWPYTPWWFM